MTEGFNKEAMEQVITGLFDATKREAEVDYGALVDAIIAKYHYFDLKNPESFNLLLFNSTWQMEQIFIERAIGDVDLPPKEKHRLEFMYIHCNFIKKHLENLIVKFEGHGCSADKSRALMRAYSHYLKTGDIIPIKEGFWCIKAGTTEQWINWIDSMIDMYHGEEKQYFLTKMDIINAYTNLLFQDEE